MNKHLIVSALHRDESFLAKGIDRLIKILEAHKQEISMRDLYELEFDPVLTSTDFESVKKGKIPADIAREQQYIRKADYIWIVFPIWWAGMPAILKGYIDRVFLSGFAYSMEGDIPKGLMTDKQVIILNSMGMSNEDYQKEGMFRALELTMDKGVFEFSGMKVLAHKYFTSIMSADDAKREKYLDEIEILVNNIINETRNNRNPKEKKVA